MRIQQARIIAKQITKAELAAIARRLEKIENLKELNRASEDKISDAKAEVDRLEALHEEFLHLGELPDDLLPSSEPYVEAEVAKARAEFQPIAEVTELLEIVAPHGWRHADSKYVRGVAYIVVAKEVSFDEKAVRDQAQADHDARVIRDIEASYNEDDGIFWSLSSERASRGMTSNRDVLFDYVGVTFQDRFKSKRSPKPEDPP